MGLFLRYFFQILALDGQKMVALQGKTHNLLLLGLVAANNFEHKSDCEIFNPGRRTVSRRPAIGKMTR